MSTVPAQALIVHVGFLPKFLPLPLALLLLLLLLLREWARVLGTFSCSPVSASPEAFVANCWATPPQTIDHEWNEAVARTKGICVLAISCHFQFLIC